MPVRIPELIGYFVLYITLYSAFGVASPFLPRFFETQALTPQQIGLVLAGATLTRLLSGPLVAMLADMTGALRLVLAGCAAFSAAAAAAFIWADTFWQLFMVALLQAAALAPTTSIADALTVNVAKTRMAGARCICCDSMERCRDRRFCDQLAVVGSRNCRSVRIFPRRSSNTRSAWRAWRSRFGGFSGNRPVVFSVRPGTS